VLVAAGCVCALAGIVIGAPTLRLKSDYLALVTLGFGEIIPQIFLNAETFTNGAKGIAPLDNVSPLPFGPASISIGKATIAISKPLGPFDVTAKYVLFVIVAAFCVCSLRIREDAGTRLAGDPRGRAGGADDGRPAMRTKLAACVGAFMGGWAA
jgi:branched-chain amino acid transport system permease protein